MQQSTLEKLETSRKSVMAPRHFANLTFDPKTLFRWPNLNFIWTNSYNGTAHIEKCKQLFEYQHLLLLRDI